MSTDPPAVALVPGFLGFEHKAGYTYFADRFVSSLRAALLAKTGRHVPVIPISTLPIASLKDRQADLLSDLSALEHDNDARRGIGKRSWHLLGHSTGGLDAALLLRDAPLVCSTDEKENPARASSFSHASFSGEQAELVARIQSATSIAAPHFGTALAECPLARVVQGRASPVTAAHALLDGLWKLPDIASRDDLASRFGYATGGLPPLADAPKFLWQLLFQNALARDLRPIVASALSQRPLRSEVADRLFSIVTVAPEPMEDHSDQLFVDLWRWTAEGDGPALPVPPAATPALDTLALRLPSQRAQSLPTLDARANDGVVSSLRQAAGAVIGVVLGDHADVLGRYRRLSPVDGKPVDAGLLTSGAEFGDDPFFELIERVADNLAKILFS